MDAFSNIFLQKYECSSYLRRWNFQGIPTPVHTALGNTRTVGHFAHNPALTIVYALLENKRLASYLTVIRYLSQRCPRLNPVTVGLDFEKVEHNSSRSVYPRSEIQGCLVSLLVNCSSDSSELYQIFSQTNLYISFSPQSMVSHSFQLMTLSLRGQS